MKKRLFDKEWLIGAILVAVSFIWRLWLAATLPPPSDGSDAYAYRQMALQVLSGTGTIGHYFNPGMSFFLTAVYGFVGDAVFHGRVVIACVGILFSVSVFKLADEAVGRKAAWVAFLVSLFDPFVSFYAVTEWGEIVMFTLVTGCLVFLLRNAREPSLKRLAMAGICAGLATLFKSWLYVFIPMTFGYRIFLSGSRSWRFALRELAVVAVFCFAVVMPWIVHLYRETGHVILSSTNGPLIFFYGNNPLAEVGFNSSKTDQIMNLIGVDAAMDQFEINRRATVYAWNFIRNNPTFVVKKFASFFLEYWTHPSRLWTQRDWPHFELKISWLWIRWTLTLIGLVCCLPRLRRDHAVFVLFWGAATGAYGFTTYLMRYKDILLPIQLVYVGMGACLVARILRACGAPGTDETAQMGRPG